MLLLAIFPLVKYPAVVPLPQNTEDLLVKKKYYFDNSNDSDSFFTLGVYGLFQYNHHLLLASDPKCLFAQLYLMKKNNLHMRLIKKVKDIQELQSSIMIVAHQASVNLQLPMLVENSNYGKPNYKRTVRSNNVIEDLSYASLDNKQFLLTLYIDQVFWDMWLYTVFSMPCLQAFSLCSVNDHNNPLIKIEAFYENSKDSWYKKLLWNNLKESLVETNQFSLRYPNFSHPTLKNSQLINNEVQDIIENFSTVLKSLPLKLPERLQKPVDIFDLKLISYTILIQTFMKETKLYQVIDLECPILFKFAQTKLNSLVN